jgi:hypothetical protein
MATRDSFRGLATAVGNAVNGAPVGTPACAGDTLGRVVPRDADSFGRTIAATGLLFYLCILSSNSLNAVKFVDEIFSKMN